MKELKILTLLVVLAVASTASIAEDNTEICKHYARVAGSAMEVRQEGHSILEALDMADNLRQANLDKLEENNLDYEKYGHVIEDQADMLKQYITYAYTKPHYSTDEYKKQEVNNFINEIYLDCLDRYE
ncbi:hypothetical protein [Psychrobacter urativorans]|uniref:hypothetical protein n=1 Tax=Psychrobacter urativorans TaxID=45610 RepID=UPI00191AF041|nr:hypothetical protein [Psychrobacter urativorans]